MYMMMIMLKADQPWEIDTRHLAALAAIARTRSLSRAAEELNYVQSAVSQQLAALERIVGHRLVNRGTGPKPVTLTVAGASLLAHATWILDRLKVARADLDRLETGASGSIRIGTFQSAGSRLLPRVLAAYRASWPDISISIHNEIEDGELLALVRSGALDVAFVESHTTQSGLTDVELMKDRFLALVPPGHRLAHRSSIALAELDGEDLIGAAIGDTCSERIDRAFRACGVEPRVAFRSVDNPTRQRLVDAGLGCAVQPGLTVEPSLEHGAVTVPLDEDIHRTISLAWSSDRAPSFALTTFIDTAKSTLADMAHILA